MNILIFVISLVMLLSLMTYGRLDMYRNFMITQGEFERYIVKEERNAINSGAEQWYKWTNIANKKRTQKSSASSEGVPYISIYSLTNPKNDPIEISQEQVQKELLKRLIHILFSSRTEFQESLNKNPNAVDDLIQAIEMAASKLSQEKKSLKNISELLKLDLENPQLQDLYYWIMKGYKVPIAEDATGSPFIEENSDTDSDDDANESAGEYLHQRGTISLLDFITLNNKNKIRVFLAPPQILFAIFGDPYTVDDVVKTRQEMYQQMQNNGDSKTLSEQFKEKFFTRANIPDSALDFSVSTTNPRQYEIKQRK